jgi:hypothetical protein
MDFEATVHLLATLEQAALALACLDEPLHVPAETAQSWGRSLLVVAHAMRELCLLAGAALERAGASRVWQCLHQHLWPRPPDRDDGGRQYVQSLSLRLSRQFECVVSGRHHQRPAQPRDDAHVVLDVCVRLGPERSVQNASDQHRHGPEYSEAHRHRQ